MERRRILSVAAAVAIVAAGPASGENILSELKLGILAHDVPLLSSHEEPGLDLNAEVLFASPELLDVLWSPRPHLGVSVATEGETSQLYAGLTWTFRPFEDRLEPVWLSAFGGGAVHTGRLESNAPDEKELGSRALFRFGAEIGVDVTDRLSVALYYAHISNGFLADPNEGLDTAGVRLGWRF